MKHVKLDRIDLSILRELQKDGRMTNVELAQHVGISAPPCLRRVRALEEAGYIRGYHADVDASKLGYGITVFTQVSLSAHTEQDLRNFAKLCDAWPQVRESYLMTGDADFMIKIVAEDWAAFQNFLTHDLASAPNVSQYKSAPAMQRTKFEPGVPVDEKHASTTVKKDDEI